MSTLIPLLLLIPLLWLNYVSKKYANDAKLYMLFGKKGCGKTTDICKKSMKYRSKGRTVYTTEFIPDTYHIEPEDVGPYEFEPYSVIFIDEIGLVWHCRDYKTLSKEIRAWFKLQRHRHLTVYMYSQVFDADKTLRDLCDELWIVKSYFNIFSYKKKIKKDLKILEAKGDQESRVADDLKVLPWFIPGSRQLTYMPRYHKYFDSFAAPQLQHKVFEFIPAKLFPSTKETILSWIKQRLHIKNKAPVIPMSVDHVQDSLFFPQFERCSIDVADDMKGLYGVIKL